MLYLFISCIQPLVPLLDFNISSRNIDLHNWYNCIDIVHSDEVVEFHFEIIADEQLIKEKNLKIIFSGIAEYSINDKNLIKYPDFYTIVNFARGELLPINKYYGNKEIRYFFLEFENDLFVEVFCKDAIIILW
jgi:hypothetical protein